eukprot:13752620-Alexandrium_andersonii.AAC.1
MSASLVGSEMCIRDRRTPASRMPQSSAACARSCVTPLPSASPSVQRQWLSAGPVSYTHLTLPTICSV